MSQAETFKELDLVCLLAAVTTNEGEEVPAGTFGTVVGVYANGEAYEIEFVDGRATVRADQLTTAPV